MTPNLKIENSPREFDYTRGGCSIVRNNHDGYLRIVGYFNCPKIDDFIIFEGHKYKRLYYRVIDVDYKSDADMWFADVICVRGEGEK